MSDNIDEIVMKYLSPGRIKDKVSLALKLISEQLTRNIEYLT